MFYLTKRDLERFNKYINVKGKNECWPWIGKSIAVKGYGLFTIIEGTADNRKWRKDGVKVVASRLACFLAHGPAPEGLPHALHSCDNTWCCNPAHLRWGTQKQNTKDMMERGQYSPPPRNTDYRRRDTQPKGEGHYYAKLTETVVREIWRLHMDGIDCGTIAQTVGFQHASVYDVCRGRSWRHLPDAPSLETLKLGGVRRGFNQFNAS